MSMSKKNIATVKQMLKDKVDCLDKRNVLNNILPLDYDNLDRDLAIEILCALGWEWRNSILSKEETIAIISNIMKLPFMDKLSIGEQKYLLKYNSYLLHYFKENDFRLQKAALQDEKNNFTISKAITFPEDFLMRRNALYLAIMRNKYYLLKDNFMKRFNALDDYDQYQLIEKVYMNSIRIGRATFDYDYFNNDKGKILYNNILVNLVSNKKGIVDKRLRKGYPITENSIFNDAEEEYISEIYRADYINEKTIIDLLIITPNTLKNEGLLKYLHNHYSNNPDGLKNIFNKIAMKNKNIIIVGYNIPIFNVDDELLISILKKYPELINYIKKPSKKLCSALLDKEFNINTYCHLYQFAELKYLLIAIKENPRNIQLASNLHIFSRFFYITAYQLAISKNDAYAINLCQEYLKDLERQEVIDKELNEFQKIKD